jgi:hypothetical protein
MEQRGYCTPGRICMEVTDNFIRENGGRFLQEQPAIVLRPGNVGSSSSTAVGRIEAARLALAQLPRRLRRKVLARSPGPCSHISAQKAPADMIGRSAVSWFAG